MPQRGFDTAYWTDPFILRLPSQAKMLYAYLWTNMHCNQAGLYQIAPETIAFETGLTIEELPECLHLLEPKVAWYPEQNLIWVKNFLRHQTRSPKFLVAAAKCLKPIRNNGMVLEFIEFNRQYNVSLPYEYPMPTVATPCEHPKDTVPIPDSGTDAITDADSHADTVPDKGLGVAKGEGDEEFAEISQLYEANIGMLTPVIAERLRDVRARYPPGWFKAALEEAVGREHRNLKYIEAILERWKVEGFKSGRRQGNEGAEYSQQGRRRSGPDTDQRDSLRDGESEWKDIGGDEDEAETGNQG